MSRRRGSAELVAPVAVRAPAPAPAAAARRAAVVHALSCQPPPAPSPHSSSKSSSASWSGRVGEPVRASARRSMRSWPPRLSQNGYGARSD